VGRMPCFTGCCLLPSLQAEAELLAAITLFFERVGLSSKDVGIKVSNRKVRLG